MNAPEVPGEMTAEIVLFLGAMGGLLLVITLALAFAEHVLPALVRRSQGRRGDRFAGRGLPAEWER